VETAVFPTPTIGMLGLMEGLEKRMTLHFKNIGDRLYLLGPIKEDINSSEYLYSFHKVQASSAPWFDLETEVKIQALTSQLIEKQLIASAHDLSDGGLYVALAESAMAANLGFAIQTSPEVRKDAFLFGESQSRILVSVNEAQVAEFERVCAGNFYQLGQVVANDFVIDGQVWTNCQQAKESYDNLLDRLMA